MKRFGIVILVLVFAIGVFWVGLIVHFPGDAVSRYVEARVNRHQGFDLALSPAELHWDGLYVPHAELRRRDNPQARPLFVLNDFVVPITWRLIQGLPARARVGEQGRVTAFLPWSRGEHASLDGKLELGEIPLPAVLAPIKLSGKLELDGRFLMDAEAQVGTQLPDGTLRARARELVVSGLPVGGFTVPSTRLDSATLVLDTGRTVNLQEARFQGDLQGSVTGTITPNLRNPRVSLLALRITTSFREAWLASLGEMRPIVESFSERGRIVLTLNGTVGRPQLQPVRGGG